jgi:hypothetical protein
MNSAAFLLFIGLFLLRDAFVNYFSLLIAMLKENYYKPLDLDNKGFK